jgi:carbamoyltransferase
VDAVVFAEKPFQSYAFDRTRRSGSVGLQWLGRVVGALAPRTAHPWVVQASRTFPRADLRFAWHHLSHVVGAYYTSGGGEAAFLCVDGKGEDANASFGRIDGRELVVHGEQLGEAGLGMFYTLITHYLGFASFGSEYKVMGLAPYGRPRFVAALESLLLLDDDGGAQLRPDVRFAGDAIARTLGRVAEATGIAVRRKDDALGQEHADIAASLQEVFEAVVLRMARTVRDRTGLDRLIFAGGCAQNCVAAGKLLRSGLFREVLNSPVGGDMGTGLGAALLDQRQQGWLTHHAVPDHGYYLGGEPGAVPDEALAHRVDSGDVHAFAAAAMAQGKIVAWCRGRMELGARALGARSILADARQPGMQSRLNLAVKFREGFRPFAPVILEEHADAWFECPQPSRYMQFVAPLRAEHRRPRSDQADGAEDLRGRLDEPRAEIQSVIHVDYSARIQTVAADTHPDLHRLLTVFREQTGSPVLINTSFNVAGEPIVRTAADAWESFRNTDIDYLVVNDLVLANPNDRTREEKLAWSKRYANSA